MKYFPIIVIAVTMIILSAMLFSASTPERASAMTESESTLVFTIFRRIQNIEKQEKVAVPEELKFYINCSETMKQQGQCTKE